MEQLGDPIKLRDFKNNLCAHLAEMVQTGRAIRIRRKGVIYRIEIIKKHLTLKNVPHLIKDNGVSDS